MGAGTWEEEEGRGNKKEKHCSLTPQTHFVAAYLIRSFLFCLEIRLSWHYRSKPVRDRALSCLARTYIFSLKAGQTDLFIKDDHSSWIARRRDRGREEQGLLCSYI